jgi:superfamily II DNA/RNA helicase
MEYMGQACGPDDRNKVLIAVTDIAAEGFNLQRVNNVWFMELPPTLTKYLQAVGRAHRTGQKMRVNIVKMYDQENLLEKFGFRGLTSKKAIAERVYNVQMPRSM